MTTVAQVAGKTGRSSSSGSRPPADVDVSDAKGREDEGVADAAWRLARSGASLSVWEAFEERALNEYGSLCGDEIVQLLHACTFSKRRPRRLLDKIAGDIPKKMSEFNASGLCVCLHTYAQLRRREGKLFSAVTKELLQPSKIDDLRPAHVASLLYSHVRALQSDAGLVSLGQEWLSTRAHQLSMEDMATCLQAFATWQVKDEVVATSCARAAADRSDSASLAALTDVMAALVKMRISCEALQRGLLRRCEAQPMELERLSAPDLAKLLRGLGSLSGSREVCIELAHCLGNRLEELDGQLVFVQAVEALAQARVGSLGDWKLAEDLAKTFALKALDFSVKDLAAIAAAFKNMDVKEPSAWEALVRQGLRKGWQFRPRFARVVLDACEAAGFEHPVVDELKASTQRYEEEAAEKEARKAAEAAAKDEEDAGMDGVNEDQDEHERALERLLEAEEGRPVFDQFVAPAESAEDGGGPVRVLPGGPRKQVPKAPPEPSRSDAEAREELEVVGEPKPVDEDPEVRRMLRDAERSVLKPAGMYSQALEDERRRERVGRGRRSRAK